jgi:hypothetical protein
MRVDRIPVLAGGVFDGMFLPTSRSSRKLRELPETAIQVYHVARLSTETCYLWGLSSQVGHSGPISIAPETILLDMLGYPRPSQWVQNGDDDR